jgi:hypothetical protein
MNESPIEDGEKFLARIEKLPDDEASLAMVQRWRDTLRDTANAALEQDGVPKTHVRIPDDERQSLELAKRKLYAIDELLKIIQALPYQHAREHALSCLCSTIGTAFVIGSHASISETQRLFQDKKRQSKGGSGDRKRTPRQALIDALIEQRLRAKPDHSDNAIADWVLKEVGDPKLAKTTVLKRIKGVKQKIV